MSLLLIGAGILLLLAIIGGGLYFVRHKIPMYQALWMARHGKALEVAKKGHDLVVEAQWSDGKCTYMGADYQPDDDELYLPRVDKNVKIEGELRRTYIGGVPVVRCYMKHACPVDPRVAVVSHMEDAGEYERVDADGQALDAADGSVTMDDGLENGDGADGVATDGGLANHEPNLENNHDYAEDHQYDYDDNADGYIYSLKEAAYYAPWTMSPQDLREQEERAKVSAQVSGTSELKTFALGMVAVIGLLFALGILYVLISALVGGGGSLIPALLAPAVPRLAGGGD